MLCAYANYTTLWKCKFCTHTKHTLSPATESLTQRSYRGEGQELLIVQFVHWIVLLEVRAVKAENIKCIRT